MIKKLLGFLAVLGLMVSPVIAAEQAGSQAQAQDQGKEVKAEKKKAKKAKKAKAKKAENATQEAPKQ